jgi:uncharacterized protein
MIAAKQGYGRFVAMMFAIASPFLATGCAAPPLSLYTLEPPDPRSEGTPLGRRASVVEVRHAVIPDYLDSQDILIRNGTRLERSPRGRWASRLSTTITRYLTGILAARYPNALVTDQPQVGTPNNRIFIRISTFDVTRAGTATLEADWAIVPRNAAQPERLQRARFTASGPVATDQEVVTLMQSVLIQLADAIDVAKLR